MNPMDQLLAIQTEANREVDERRERERVALELEIRTEEDALLQAIKSGTPSRTMQVMGHMEIEGFSFLIAMIYAQECEKDSQIEGLARALADRAMRELAINKVRLKKVGAANGGNAAPFNKSLRRTAMTTVAHDEEVRALTQAHFARMKALGLFDADARHDITRHREPPWYDEMMRTPSKKPMHKG